MEIRDGKNKGKKLKNEEKEVEKGNKRWKMWGEKKRKLF